LPSSVKSQLRRSRSNARGYYDEELTKNRRDWKEVYDYGAERSADGAAGGHSDGVNQWPADHRDLRDVLLRHYKSCEGVARALLRTLSVSLGVGDDTLSSHFDRHTSFVRLNRYAPCPDPAIADTPMDQEGGHFGVHHHSDAGAITVLYQDTVPGLQVFHAGQWVVVEPVQGALTINLGDMLQVWSNDRYCSPLHRVLVHRDRTRHSAPFFFNPNYEAVCEPLSGLLAKHEAPQFRPITWSHFRDQRSAGDYADYGTEIQIEDYRIAQ
jgi:isopenicillin N synthase-like dioxygenase